MDAERNCQAIEHPLLAELYNDQRSRLFSLTLDVVLAILEPMSRGPLGSTRRITGERWRDHKIPCKNEDYPLRTIQSVAFSPCGEYVLVAPLNTTHMYTLDRQCNQLAVTDGLKIQWPGFSQTSVDADGNTYEFTYSDREVLVRRNIYTSELVDTRKFNGLDGKPFACVPIGDGRMMVSTSSSMYWIDADGRTEKGRRLPATGAGSTIYCPKTRRVYHAGARGILACRAGSKNLFQKSTQLILIGKRTHQPLFLACDADGNLIVAHQEDQQIKIFTHEGVLVRTIQFGVLNSASAIAVDNRGHIWVAFHGSPCAYLREYFG